MKKYYWVIIICILLASCAKKEDILPSYPISSKEQSITLANGLVFVKDGEYYRNDDMLFHPSEGTKGVFSKDEIKYWPNGIVYYEFDSNADSTLIANATLAMTELSDSTGVQFVAKPSYAPNYIRFQLSSENNSYVGMKGNMQEINIVSKGKRYVIMHEIMHALGVFHEHARIDRDDYITINWSNLKPGKEYAFYKQSTSSAYDYGAFNFESIMLYPSMINDLNFVYDSSVPAITKKDNSIFTANRSYLSHGDIKTVKQIYSRPYAQLAESVEVYQDYVSGIEEVYDAEYEWIFTFYEDPNLMIPTFTVHPRYITLRKETRYLDQNGNVRTTTTYEYVNVPAGTSSIVVASARNREVYYNGDPYIVDTVYYYLVSWN